MRRLMLLSAILAAGLVSASGASAATPKPGAWKLTGSDGHGHTFQAAFVITRRGGEAHKFPVTHPSCRQYYLVGSGEFSANGGRLRWVTRFGALSGRFTSRTRASGIEHFNWGSCKGRTFRWKAKWYVRSARRTRMPPRVPTPRR